MVRDAVAGLPLEAQTTSQGTQGRASRGEVPGIALGPEKASARVTSGQGSGVESLTADSDRAARGGEGRGVQGGRVLDAR
jgi:hypothetical protein